MRSRLRVVAGTLAVTVIAAALAAAVAPGTAAAGVGKARPGTAFAPAGNVRTLAVTTGGSTSVRAAAGVPQSFCYVFVDQFTTGGIYRAQWDLDCRSVANPRQPAPDIVSLRMFAAIHTGDPYSGNTQLRRILCFTPQQALTTLRCSVEVPLQFGVQYYSRMDAEAYLVDADPQFGSFVTVPFRLT